jgi:hypothetical protein
MKNYPVSFGFLFILALVIFTSGCGKNEEVPFVDAPITLDTLVPEPQPFELFLGTYGGPCYSYKRDFSMEINGWVVERDTFDDGWITFTLKEEKETFYRFNFISNTIFYPYPLFAYKQEFEKDTVFIEHNFSYFNIEVNWFKTADSMHITQESFNNNSSSPGYSSIDCYCTKVE